MSTFEKDILAFLAQEYQDAFVFKLERIEPTKDLELTITYNSCFCKKIDKKYMAFIQSLWVTSAKVPGQNLYSWQKELVDIIEGS